MRVTISYTYPGVYIQELPSPVHSIAAAATSIAAFVGYTPFGIDNRAEPISSFADFERQFGGLASNSELSYAVQQFYQNGGSLAYVVRVPMHGATPASVTFGGLTFTALSSGAWANGQLLIDVDVQNINLTSASPGDPYAFNLTITDQAHNATESFASVTLNPNAMNYVETVINDPDNGSQLVNISAPIPPPTTAPTTAVAVTGVVGTQITLSNVNNVLGGSNTATTVSETDNAVGSNYAGFGLEFNTSQPSPLSPLPISVNVFPKGTPIPQSVSGLATALQQALNAVLAVQMPGASVQCSATQVGSPATWPPTNWALRVNAMLPQQPDAVVTFAAPASGSGLGDVLGALGLSGIPQQNENVAHYALGTGHGYASGVQGGETATGTGTDGTALPDKYDLIGDPAQFTGIYALQKVDQFNLLSIPDATRALPSSPTTLDPSVDPVLIYSSAIQLCDTRRAFLLVDPPPDITTVTGAVDWKSSGLGITDPNGAAFWPRLRLPDAKNNGNLRTFAPSGVVAGVYATTDGSSGVWKAPAGIQATLNGVQSMTYQLTDVEQGLLNPLGLNCFRTFPVYGRVLWGARTLQGADALTSQWKYVPVRRTALFLEQSLYIGTQWVVFEPNDEPLWAAIRLNVGAFMQTYFLKGAFQGQTPDQAYFVKCDSETTTQTDIDSGIVNILVGFAPLQPAEFVVIQIEQLTGQASS
jgi:phage tail sheath protein FI